MMENWVFGYSHVRGSGRIFARTSFRVLVAVALLLGAGFAADLFQPEPQASALTTVPTKMHFQGRLTDSTGNIKPNGTYNMRLKLYTVSTAGSAVWSEDRLVSATQGVQVTNGLFSIQLGSITTLPASLFASGDLYLEVELPTPATATSASPVWTEGPMTPRNQMATSAYAYNSETLDGQDGAWYQDASNLNAGVLSAARLSGSYTGITGTGALTAGSIGTGFGTIVTGNTITGTVLNGTTGINTGAGAGTQRIDAGGNLVNIGNVTLSGSVLQGGYGAADAATDNMVINGDFERNNTTGWTGITDIQTGGYSGNYAAHFTGPRTLESVDYIPVDPTRDVLQLEVYVKKTVAGATPGTMYFGYKAYNASKTVIGTAPCGSYCYFAASNATVPADGAWHKYSATTTGEGTAYPNFPVGTKYVRILGLINYTASADAETLVDHVTLRRINNGPLFVGNNFSSTNLVDQYQQTQLYTTNTGVLTVAPPSSADVNIIGGLQIGGTNIITSGRALQNITTITASNTVTGLQFTSTVATGTAPLTVASTTLVANLNSDLLDGQTASFFQNASNLNAGTVGVARGGTGAGAVGVAGSIAYSTGSAYAFSAAGTAGDCLISGGAASPTWGSCGGTGTILQGGNSFAATMTIGTNDAQSLVLETNNTARLTITSTGDATYEGVLTVGTGVGEASTKINGGSTGSQRLSFSTASSTTWSIGAIGGGANPSFQVQRYNAGAFVNAPFSINNSSGDMTLTGAATVTGNLTLSAGGLYFGVANPQINASSYFVAPGGAYFSSGTVYAEADMKLRGGISNDSTNCSGYLCVNDGIYTTNWFRSGGNSGWYNETYGGGMYMIDTTWVRTYASKNLYVDAGIDTGGASGVGCGGGLGGGYTFRVCGSGHTTGIMYAAGGTYTQLIGGGSSNGVCHNGADVDGTATGDMRALMVCNATPGDYAEFYPAEQGVEAGDLVATTDNMLHYESFGADPETGQTYSMGPQDISIVKKAKIGDKGIGIVSTGPWQVIGKDIPTSANRKPVALNGRVPLKVNDEGGAIQPGDRLTLSSVAGYAKKATSRGMTYAVALEAFAGSSGKILVYVDNTYYEPAVGVSDLQGTSLTLSGDAIISGSLSVGGVLNVTGATNLASLTVTDRAEFQGVLVARDAEFTGTLTVNGHIISGGDTPVLASRTTDNCLNEVTLSGTDTAGSVSFTVPAGCGAGELTAGFAKVYQRAPIAIVSARDATSAEAKASLDATNESMLFSFSGLESGRTYRFNYHVIQ